jgi:hypothetical protein
LPECCGARLQRGTRGAHVVNKKHRLSDDLRSDASKCAAYILSSLIKVKIDLRGRPAVTNQNGPVDQHRNMP